MKQSQLWRDTASLITSGSVYHSAKQDEYFVLPERNRNRERVQRVVLTQAIRILFIMGIIALVL